MCVCVCVLSVYVVPYAILAYLENAGLEKTAFVDQISPQTGENAMDKSINGSLFYRQEMYVLTLVRMGEPVTFITRSYVWL